MILIEMYVGYTNLGNDKVNFNISLMKVFGQQGNNYSDPFRSFSRIIFLFFNFDVEHWLYP